MIDPLSEKLISLTHAAKQCPARRSGKRPSVSCLYRWTTTGCKGVVLESVQVGGTRCTTREALARFFKRLTMRVDSLQCKGDQNRKEADRAATELEKQGF